MLLSPLFLSLQRSNCLLIFRLHCCKSKPNSICMLRRLVVVANGRITMYLYLSQKTPNIFFSFTFNALDYYFFCIALNCTLKFLTKVGSTSRKLQYKSTAFSLFASNCWFKDCWIWWFYFKIKKLWLNIWETCWETNEQARSTDASLANHLVWFQYRCSIRWLSSRLFTSGPLIDSVLWYT